MHRSEAQALGKLAGAATAGTVSLAKGLHEALFARYDDRPVTAP